MISLIVVAGIWVNRKRLLPEIAYVAAPMPLLTLMMPSTSRYLMSYQPFFWIFFWSGAAFAASRLPVLRRAFHSRPVVLGAVGVLVAVSIGLRAWKVAGSLSERYFAVTVKTAPAYVQDVSSTFRSLRQFIETMPRDRALLIGYHGSYGRWKIISNRDYYRPDDALAAVTREKDVYLVIECGTREFCASWKWWKEQRRKDVTRFGAFRLDSVFAVASPLARAQVDRITAIQ